MDETEIIIEPGKQDVVFKRTFDAPRDIVFRALTDPTLIPSWWGPRKYETIVDVMEPRPGGRWRFLNRNPETGEEFGFHGVFHTVTPDLVVQTNEFEGFPGVPALEWMTLEETEGKTLLTAVSLAPSVEVRDMVVATGMESGARETYDRLDEVIQGLVGQRATA
ncbi:MAG: SRPBCC family protein [Candidatus Limnocylindrales bacterium]